jgi:hypothetical protein
MGAQENSLLVIPWSESAERPLAAARGDIKVARGDSTFLSFRAKREISPSCPHPVMPSVARHPLLGHGKRLELRTTKNR